MANIISRKDNNNIFEMIIMKTLRLFIILYLFVFNNFGYYRFPN